MRAIFLAVAVLVASGCGEVRSPGDAGQPMADGGPPSHAAYCLTSIDGTPTGRCIYLPDSDTWYCGPCSTCMDADGGAVCPPRP